MRKTILLGLISAAAMLAGTYTFQDVNYPADTFTQLLGINNSGTVAGYHNATVFSGFTFTQPSNFTTLNFPGSAQTQVVGINTAGNTDGFYIDNAGNTHGFIDQSNTFTTVDAPGTAFNQLLGINDIGQEAGYSSVDATGVTLQLAYIRSSGGVFTYVSGLPGGTLNSQATGINNSGEVGGFYQDSAGVFHGFLVVMGVFSSFNAPVAGETGTQILGLNNNGQFVGFYLDAVGNSHGFVDSSGVFQTVDNPLGVGTTTINGINDLGQVVGFFNGDVTQGFIGTAIPEPATWLLGGMGLACVALIKRRR